MCTIINNKSFCECTELNYAHVSYLYIQEASHPVRDDVTITHSLPSSSKGKCM